MNLEKVKLGELYTVHNGLSKGGKYFGKGFPFLSFSAVFNNYFLPDELPDLVQSTDAERENYDIKKGDVFITRTSETSDELGMTSVALKDYPNATYNGFTKRLRPLNSFKVFPKYIGYYLRTQKFRKGFMAFSTMTTRASLKNEDLLNMEIWLPSYSIQINIADKLSLYDDLIENNQKQIKLLEEAAQRLYKEWFVDLRFPGYEQTKIVDGVPEGWEKGSLEQIGFFKRGKTITSADLKDGVVPVIAGGIEPAYYHNKANTVAPVVTVSGSGANAGYTSLHHVDVFASDCSYADNLATPYVYFIYCFLKANKACLNNLQKGAAQPHVYAKDINIMNIIVPTNIVLDSFTEAASLYFIKIKNIKQQITLLAEARDRLLPKLMNGEIEV